MPLTNYSSRLRLFAETIRHSFKVVWRGFQNRRRRAAKVCKEAPNDCLVLFRNDINPLTLFAFYFWTSVHQLIYLLERIFLRRNFSLFCVNFARSNFNEDIYFFISLQSYVALAKGALNEDHVLICAIAHHNSTAVLPDVSVYIVLV